MLTILRKHGKLYILVIYFVICHLSGQFEELAKMPSNRPEKLANDKEYNKATG